MCLLKWTVNAHIVIPVYIIGFILCSSYPDSMLGIIYLSTVHHMSEKKCLNVVIRFLG